jgi:hypothetical protein
MAERMFDVPSVLARLEKTGVVETETAGILVLWVWRPVPAM